MPAKHLHRVNDKGIYSHIYNKGVEKRLIFNDDQDYAAFKSFLNEYLTSPDDRESTKKNFTVNGRVFQGTPHQPKNYFNKVELIAYSLSPDHFHLLLYQKTPGSIVNFIRSLSTRYSIYFNKKYKRTGTLFEGPYKSSKVTGEQNLAILTAYLHHTRNDSSYPEYLGIRNTPWVKTKTILSLYDQLNDYKELVDTFDLNQAQNDALKSIILDDPKHHLERSDLASEAEKPLPVATPKVSEESIVVIQNLKPYQRIPELLAVTLIFLLLVAIGATNIMIARANSAKAFSLAAAVPTINSVSSFKKVLGISISPKPTTSPLPSPVTKPAEETSEVLPVAKTMVTVQLEGASSVNIRQQSSASSKKIGKAKNGDSFELVSEDTEWSQIKLEDGSIGFIATKYLKTGGTQ